MSFGTMIRCKNWEEEPEICQPDCGVLVTREQADGFHWVTVMLDRNPEWFVMLRSCPEHGRHMDPYCSLTCFTRYHARHEHHDAP